MCVRGRNLNKFVFPFDQVLAIMAKNLTTLDIGISLSFSTIVIPALRHLDASKTEKHVSLTNNEISWYGKLRLVFFLQILQLELLDNIIIIIMYSQIVSLAFAFQPFGSLLSGIVSQHLGRKRTLLIMNIPFFISWVLLYTAEKNYHFYLATSMHGLAQGMVEAPLFAYGSEIW